MSDPNSLFVDVDALDWQATDFPGISMKELWRSDDGLSFTALFRFEPGARLPQHRHEGLEQTFVLFVFLSLLYQHRIGGQPGR